MQHGEDDADRGQGDPLSSIEAEQVIRLVIILILVQDKVSECHCGDRNYPEHHVTEE